MPTPTPTLTGLTVKGSRIKTAMTPSLWVERANVYSRRSYPMDDSHLRATNRSWYRCVRARLSVRRPLGSRGALSRFGDRAGP
jgi:hypothetical protein